MTITSILSYIATNKQFTVYSVENHVGIITLVLCKNLTWRSKTFRVRVCGILTPKLSNKNTEFTVLTSRLCTISTIIVLQTFMYSRSALLTKRQPQLFRYVLTCIRESLFCSITRSLFSKL